LLLPSSAIDFFLLDSQRQGGKYINVFTESVPGDPYKPKSGRLGVQAVSKGSERTEFITNSTISHPSMNGHSYQVLWVFKQAKRSVPFEVSEAHRPV